MLQLLHQEILHSAVVPDYPQYPLQLLPTCNRHSSMVLFELPSRKEEPGCVIKYFVIVMEKRYTRIWVPGGRIGMATGLLGLMM